MKGLEPMQQVGDLIKWSKEEELQNSFKRLSSQEILKSANKQKLSYEGLLNVTAPCYWSQKYWSLRDGGL